METPFDKLIASYEGKIKSIKTLIAQPYDRSLHRDQLNLQRERLEARLYEREQILSDLKMARNLLPLPSDNFPPTDHI